VDDRKAVEVDVLDFSKAFDTVPFRSLLDKLSSHEISSYMVHRVKNCGMGLLVSGDCSNQQCSSELGVLFSIFISDLEAGVECTISKFADDTKLGGALASLEAQEALQRGLNRLERWAIINDMKFNKNKCWKLHLGQSNARHKYRLGEDWLESSPAERGLGMLPDGLLHGSHQCWIA